MMGPTATAWRDALVARAAAAATAAAGPPRGGGHPFLDALAAACRRAVAAPLRGAPPGVAAAAAPAAGPQAAAAAGDGLARRIEELLAEPLTATGGGISYAVARGGVTIAAGALGEADVELGVPMTAASRTDLASVTKQFTAFLLFWLDHRGALSLDDDVRTYVPELPRYPGATVTLRHIVHHASGLLDHLVPLYLSLGGVEDNLPRPSLLATIFRQTRLRFQPGTAWEYSNTNYELAGLVAERVTGKPLARLFREVIFDPLGMKDSDLYDSQLRMYSGLASSYDVNITEAPVPGGPFAVSQVRAPRQAVGIGATGIVTTPADLLRWADNYRNNTLGGGRGLVEAMLTPYVLRAANGTALPGDYTGSGGYGGGLFIEDAPINETTTVRLIHHGGAIAGYRSMFLLVPDEGLAIVLQATSSVFGSDIFQAAGKIALLTAPDALGGGEDGNSPEPTAVKDTPDATDEPMATPSPAPSVAVSRKALAAAAGVWVMDGVQGAAGTFEVRVHCKDVATTGGKKRQAEGDSSSDDDDDRRESGAGCQLFVDLGWLSRSLLTPVSATRFVGDLAGLPGALSMEVSPPANSTTTAELSVMLPDQSGTGTAVPVTQTATRLPALQVGAAALAAAAGTYISDEVGVTYTFVPRGGGLGLVVDGEEGRLGSTLLPCCVDAAGDWGGTYTSARPALVSQAELGGRRPWLTMTFRGDAAALDAEDNADGRGDLAGVPFRREGTCPA